MTTPILWHVYQDIVRHAKDGYPNETGGLVVQYQSSGIAQQRHFPIENVHAEPKHNFAGEASATISAYQFAAEYSDLGGHVAFEWHSHPTTPAVPSGVDSAMYRPCERLVLVSLASPDGVPEVEAYKSNESGELNVDGWVTF